MGCRGPQEYPAAHRLEDERRGAWRELLHAQRPAWNSVLGASIATVPGGIRAWSFATLTFPPAFFEDRYGRQLSMYAMHARASAAFEAFVEYAGDGQADRIEWVRATELHQSGLIHFHALLAGQFPTRPMASSWIRARVGILEGDWRAVSAGGISRFRPVNARRVWYLTKYVTKGGLLDWSDTFARRASERASTS